MKNKLPYLNGLAFLLVITINYLSNTGIINNTTIGEVSGEYRNLFTPAGYAFAIWGLIYLLLAGFVVYQFRALWKKERAVKVVNDTSGWFLLSCVANSAWVFCWLYGNLLLSLICMFTLLFALLKIVWRNDMEIWDAPISIIAFVWWPFVIYSGWIAVASIANVAAYLTSIEWSGWGISEMSWTLMMIGVATSLNLLILWKRNMREFAAVGAWALIAIGIANKESHDVITNVSFVAAALLLLAAAVHGILNYKTNPFFKLKEYFSNNDR
ncbi:MAG: tryptophan-rich sensory protein [Flavobacteriaceae bacterium]|nr:tryptophan-rich sensory protein [Flavobacteriaceae bacterium]